MSFQSINSNFLQSNYQTPLWQIPMQNVQTAVYPVTNPYETSFWDKGVMYPFNPIYQPKINPNYVYLGQIKSADNETVSLFQLNSGHRVAILPRRNQATIVKTFLNAGSMNETDELRGISHVIEHCLFKGSSKLADGDVFKLTGLMGASTNASTDFAKTDYYITAPYMDNNNLAKTIEIQGDMVSNPTFDKTALELEKGPICSEISMINDDMVSVGFDRLIKNLFQIPSDSKNLVAGSIATVKGLNRDDLVNHHQTYYSPNDLCTVVVGDVDIDETMNLISKNFTLQPTSKNQGQKLIQQLNPIQTSSREDIKTDKANFTTVMLGFSGYQSDNTKDMLIMNLLQIYLSSFSTSDLKNRLEKISGAFGLTEQKVGLNPTDPYALVGIMNLNPRDEQKGIDIFYDAILKLQNQPLSNEDVDALKRNLIKEMEYSFTNSISCCNVLGEDILNNTNVFSGYKQTLSEITPYDIQNFANKYLDLNKVSTVVIHPDFVSDNEIVSNYHSSKYSFNGIKNPKKGVVSFCGNPKISTQNIREYQLLNNTHLAINDTTSKLCAFKWCVNTPPIKPKNPNAPAVLAHIFEVGSGYKNQNELERFKELNAIGAQVSVNGRSIQICADCLPENVDKTINLMNELLYNPRLTKEDFLEAKRYVKDMLKASQKDASGNLLDTLYPGYFPNLEQKLRTIDSLTFEDVQEFYGQLLSNASSYFVATLPLNEDPSLSHRVIDGLNNSNVTFKNSSPKFSSMYVPNQEETVVYDIDNLNQAQIFKSYKFKLSGNIQDEAKFELVNMILGGSANGRLFADLREQQNLAYSVYSTIQSFENTGILTLDIQTTTDHKDQGQQTFDNVQKALEGFKKHTDKMCNELVSDTELESAKNKLKQNIISQCQDPIHETSLISMNMMEPYGIKRIDKYIEAIDSVTKEDIQKAAQFIFSQKPIISILASKDTIENQMDYLKTQGTVQRAA